MSKDIIVKLLVYIAIAGIIAAGVGAAYTMLTTYSITQGLQDADTSLVQVDAMGTGTISKAVGPTTAIEIPNLPLNSTTTIPATSTVLLNPTTSDTIAIKAAIDKITISGTYRGVDVSALRFQTASNTAITYDATSVTIDLPGFLHNDEFPAIMQQTDKEYLSMFLNAYLRLHDNYALNVIEHMSADQLTTLSKALFEDSSSSDAVDDRLFTVVRPNTYNLSITGENNSKIIKGNYGILLQTTKSVIDDKAIRDKLTSTVFSTASPGTVDGKTVTADEINAFISAVKTAPKGLFLSPTKTFSKDKSSGAYIIRANFS